MFVEIGGIQQWLEIEGSGEKPVILLVHGGPGASTRLASCAWRPWLDHFTLVHWDQRGAGRTFARNGGENCQPMTFGQIVSDGLDIAAFVCGHLGKERIFVLGHSWGSAVAVHMVKRRPDFFCRLHRYRNAGELPGQRSGESCQADPARGDAIGR